jgi:hypothetical protein
VSSPRNAFWGCLFFLKYLRIAVKAVELPYLIRYPIALFRQFDHFIVFSAPFGSNARYGEKEEKVPEDTARARLLFFCVRLPFPGPKEPACAGEMLHNGETRSMSRALLRGGVVFF